MERFWEQKSLAEMSDEEWESLCDGCARCCLHKLEDEDSGEVFYTGVRCRYLVEDSCRCSDYPRRSELMPNCIDLKRHDVAALHWLPGTCAYRLLSEGKPLYAWHPLVSGRPETVHEAGISIRGRAVSDEFVHPDGYDEHIIHWVE
ncbi:MAG: YcgN family cysteine cluster protein [Halieaceae bacterium]|jgi:uncharacterized cysteine cluster protein YcgN (CxxCxxCC family)|nr:YcgN family cysteine cluster protein [Halieaceae bacterium]